MTSRDILKILRKDGWYIVDQDGSHAQLKHPTKPGKVTQSPYMGARIFLREHSTAYLNRRGLNKAPCLPPYTQKKGAIAYVKFNLSCIIRTW